MVKYSVDDVEKTFLKNHIMILIIDAKLLVKIILINLKRL